MNPYDWLHKQATSLITRDMSIDDVPFRETTSWILHVVVNGKTVVIGRAGANTCWMTFGSGNKRLMFPNVLIAELSVLAKQGSAWYVLHTDDGDRVVVFKRKLPNVPSSVRDRVTTVGFDGSKSVTRRARRGISGKLIWIS